jgi:bacterioferritin-associated ferredoxin
MATAAPPRSLGELFRQLGNMALCGRCAPSVRLIMEGPAPATSVEGHLAANASRDSPVAGLWLLNNAEIERDRRAAILRE